MDAYRTLYKEKLLSDQDVAEINKIREVRNSVVHGMVDHKAVINKSLVRQLKEIVIYLKQRFPNLPTTNNI
jgi:uncharacterized protein YutE (UPF0331/DUF86 family)